MTIAARTGDLPGLRKQPWVATLAKALVWSCFSMLSPAWLLLGPGLHYFFPQLQQPGMLLSEPLLGLRLLLSLPRAVLLVQVLPWLSVCAILSLLWLRLGYILVRFGFRRAASI